MGLVELKVVVFTTLYTEEIYKEGRLPKQAISSVAQNWNANINKKYIFIDRVA